MQTETDQCKQTETDKYECNRAFTIKNRQLQAGKKMRVETDYYKQKQTNKNRNRIIHVPDHLEQFTVSS
jgi:hypothetical protein